MENAKKGGMSKGCLVGLIIAGILIVIAIVAVVLIYMYKDEMVKVGATTMTNEVKRMVAENPPEGYDTVAVNAFADAFNEKITADTTLNLQSLGLWIQQLQPLIEDKEVSASDLETIADGMVRMYPELEDARPMEAPAEMEEAVDSMTTE